MVLLNFDLLKDNVAQRGYENQPKKSKTLVNIGGHASITHHLSHHTSKHHCMMSKQSCGYITFDFGVFQLNENKINSFGTSFLQSNTRILTMIYTMQMTFMFLLLELIFFEGIPQYLFQMPGTLKIDTFTFNRTK